MKKEISRSFENLNPTLYSFVLHFVLVIVAVGIFYFNSNWRKKYMIVPLKIIEQTITIPPNVVLQPKNPVPESKPLEAPLPKESKKIFGVSKKSIQADPTDTSAISVKAGNTVAKEQDNLKLSDSDAQSLPIPADDFLVTQGVQLIFSPKANRTNEAIKEGYTGQSLLILLIDNQGLVKDVQLLNDLKFGLNERAIEIAKQLRFKPAMVQNETVAVRVRFTITFKSSN